MTYDDNVFVLKCEVMAGMDRTELRYVKYKNYIQLCKSVYGIAPLDIVLAEDCILDIVP